MTKYGEVLDYRTADKAVVGKKYIVGNNPYAASHEPEIMAGLMNLDGQRFRYDNHSRDNNISAKELSELLLGKGNRFADSLVGFTKYPAFENRNRPMCGVMFEKSGEEFWIHAHEVWLTKCIFDAFGREVGERMVDVLFYS